MRRISEPDPALPGGEVARAAFPALDASRDLEARTANVRLALPGSGSVKGARLRVVTVGEVAEVNQRKNMLELR